MSVPEKGPKENEVYYDKKAYCCDAHVEIDFKVYQDGRSTLIFDHKQEDELTGEKLPALKHVLDKGGTEKLMGLMEDYMTQIIFDKFYGDEACSFEGVSPHQIPVLGFEREFLTEDSARFTLPVEKSDTLPLGLKKLKNAEVIVRSSSSEEGPATITFVVDGEELTIDSRFGTLVREFMVFAHVSKSEDHLENQARALAVLKLFGGMSNG